MDFQGCKEFGRLVLRDIDKRSYCTFLEKFNDGIWFNVRIVRAMAPKTLEQLGYYYAVVLPTIRTELINQGHTMNVFGVEVAIDKDQTDKLIKYFCARLDEEGNLMIHDPVNHPNRKILRKRKMSKLQASQLIDNAIQWANGVLQCQIPEAVKVI